MPQRSRHNPHPPGRAAIVARARPSSPEYDAAEERETNAILTAAIRDRSWTAAAAILRHRRQVADRCAAERRERAADLDSDADPAALVALLVEQLRSLPVDVREEVIRLARA